MKRQIVVANRLTDGRVVYLTPGGDWTTEIERAYVANNDAEAEALLETGKESARLQIVVDPYLIEAGDKGHRPVRLRERIRAEGPTIRYGVRTEARH